MANLRFLLRQLQAYIVEIPRVYEKTECSDVLEMLAAQEKLYAACVYLSDRKSFSLLEHVDIEPGTVVLVADAAGLSSEGINDSARVYLFSCSLALLHNTVAKAITDICFWKSEYWEIGEKNSGLDVIIRYTAQQSRAAVALMDRRGRVVSESGVSNSEYLENLIAPAGGLTEEMIQRMFGSRPEDENFAVWREGEHELYVIRDDFGILVLESTEKNAAIDLRSLGLCAAEGLRRRLFSRSSEQVLSHTKDFYRCWEEIAERKITGRKEIRTALAGFIEPEDVFVRVAVVSFPDNPDEVPYNYIVARLREFFPDANMAVYCKSIVILISYAERSFQIELDPDGGLKELLERYNGFIAVSHGTRKVESLAANYYLTQRTVFLGAILRQNPEERIFYHEEYSMYTVIDLCAQRYLEIDGNEDPLYLMHPAVVLLTRYDRMHNSNLNEVLYAYLLNNHNLVKTAASVHMHRNTVINKVNKIMELTELDLEDSNLCQRLMFSCQFVRYYEKVLKMDFSP